LPEPRLCAHCEKLLDSRSKLFRHFPCGRRPCPEQDKERKKKRPNEENSPVEMASVGGGNSQWFLPTVTPRGEMARVAYVNLSGKPLPGLSLGGNEAKEASKINADNVVEAPSVTGFPREL